MLERSERLGVGMGIIKHMPHPMTAAWGPNAIQPLSKAPGTSQGRPQVQRRTPPSLQASVGLLSQLLRMPPLVDRVRVPGTRSATCGGCSRQNTKNTMLRTYLDWKRWLQLKHPQLTAPKASQKQSKKHLSVPVRKRKAHAM